MLVVPFAEGGESVHRNVTNEIRLTAEDGTEYVLPADFFAGPLKPGTKGKWGGYTSRCVVVASFPASAGDIVIFDEEDGEYCVMPLASFTPDPEPTTTVMVEMSVDDAQRVKDWRGFGVPRAAAALDRVAEAAAEALKKVGLG